MKNMFKSINMTLINYPTPSNLNYYWNMGSLLGYCLLIQLLTGILLSMHYNSDITMAFLSTSHINRDVNMGWMLRYIHMNTVSLFFMMIYTHIGRGIYYSSYNKKGPWLTGFIMMIILMMTAFMGYVLPWGQMSYWGATVITNLISAIPMVGSKIVNWIWGGYSVGNPTLNRFFTLHYLMPFIMLIMTVIHITLLHEEGSSNPMGNNANIDKIPFHPFFTLKDIMGMLIMTLTLLILSFLYPALMSDPENYITSNPMTTPVHIQPEWYFLFAYAILRSIPNKLGGVIALLMSIFILLLPTLKNNYKYKSTSMSPIKKILFWSFINIFIMLTFLGSCPVEQPYMMMSQLLTLLYFLYYMALMI
nr:cytochrome b [Chiropterargas confusus]